MLKLLAYFRPRQPVAGPPYEVACTCGQILRGVRQARRQFVPCPACGRKVFVLARSPLPPPEEGRAAGPPSSRRPWRLPLIGGVSTLAILVFLFIVLAPFLGRHAPPREETKDRPDVGAQIASARQALAQGDFHLAARELQAALEQDGRDPSVLAPAERGELIRLQQQSDLLSRLSSRPLEEIVQEADPVLHDEEWQERFRRDYEGKTVLFDDEVRFEGAAGPDGRRRPVLVHYRVVANGRPVRLALEDLDVLQNLPLERPRRLLFGGRLARVEREAGGRWMVGFAPDGGALLTDRGAAEAVCPGVDKDLLEVLKRQEEWSSRLP